MAYIRRVFRGHQLESNGWELTRIILAAILFLAAAGMSYIVGDRARD